MRIAARQDSTSGAVCADLARLRLLADMNRQANPVARGTVTPVV